MKNQHATLQPSDQEGNHERTFPKSSVMTGRERVNPRKPDPENPMCDNESIEQSSLVTALNSIVSRTMLSIHSADTER